MMKGKIDNNFVEKNKVSFKGIFFLVLFGCFSIFVAIAIFSGEPLAWSDAHGRHAISDFENNQFKMLSSDIEQEEAIETCTYFVLNLDGFFADTLPSERTKISRGNDAWIIELEGAAKNDNGTWESAMFYCEVPFERVDKLETVSFKNIREIAYIGR